MGITILLLEDNEHILKINREALSTRGYLTLEAETISKGNELLNQHTPDLLICDIMLPDGDGVAFYKKLRSIRNVPCLFLSSKTSGDIPWADMDTRYVDYLAKPYRLSTLIERVETLLSRASRIADESEQDSKLFIKNTDAKKKPPPPPVITLSDTVKPAQTRRKTSPRQILNWSGAVAAAVVVIAGAVFAQSTLTLNEPQNPHYMEISDLSVPLAAPPSGDTEQTNNDSTTLVLKQTDSMQVSATALREDCGLHVFSGIADGEYMVFALLPEGAETQSVEIGKLVVTNGSADLLLDRDNGAYWQEHIEIRP